MRVKSLLVILAVTATSVVSLADRTCFNYRFRYNKDGVKSCAPVSNNLAVLCIDEQNVSKQENSPYTFGSFKITITAPDGQEVEGKTFTVRSDVTQNNEITRDYRLKVDAFNQPNEPLVGTYYQFIFSPSTPGSGFFKMYAREFCFDKI